MGINEESGDRTMKKAMYLTVVVIMSLAVLLAGCSNSEQEESDQESSSAVRMEDNSSEAENSETQMNVQVGGSEFTATLEENAAADALVEMMEQGPVTIRMSDYSGFEKVGPLGTSLPASNQQITTQSETLCCIRTIRSLCSTAPIPGAIPCWAISMISPVGKRLWAAVM